jgi:hypothetical protein
VADNDLFEAGKAKLLTAVATTSQKEKDALIETEKARVRALLKRKDLTGKDLLDVEDAMLDFLARAHGAEERTPEAIRTRGQVERVAALQNRVDGLQRQLRKLTVFDYEKTYNRVIADSKARIEKLSFELDARLAEFEVLFGKKANVEVAFDAEMVKYRPKRANIAYFINLD